MKNLVLHIRYLLTRYDCVIVPGWGALVVQHDSASFDLDNNIITPPRRWLSFNPLLAHNDGVLAHSIMRERGCTYEQAMSVIDSQIAEWREVMLHDGKVMWDKIGTFSKQEGTTMLFVEADDVEVLTTLALLQPVSLPALSQLLTPIDTEDELVDVDDITPSIRISWKRRAWQAVASIAIIVMIMLSISTPIDNFETTNDYASLVAIELLGGNVMVDDQVSLQDTAVSSALLSEDTAEVGIDNETDSSYESAVDTLVMINTEISPEIASAALEVEPSDEHPRYILVIGSLTSLSQAQAQIENFRQVGINQDIKVYENGGKYRLYIDGFSTMSQAQQRLDDLSALPDNPFSGIWICSTRQ